MTLPAARNALLALLALAAGAPRALAAPLAPPAPPACAVAPGAMVVTVLPVLPADAREFELLLVPEGGAPIRVSAELPAGAREVRWRMPAIAARRAHLVLRVGGEDDERESAPSAAFELAPLPAGELARVLQGRSEAGFTLESSAGDAAAGLGDAGGGPTIAAGGALPDAAEAPVAALVSAPAAGTRLALASPPRAPSPAARPRAAGPARVPLRI